MDGGVDEGDDEEHEQVGLAEETQRLDPGESAFARSSRFGRCVRKAETEHGEHEGGDPGDQEDVSAGGHSFDAGFALKDEVERPGGENPTDGTTHAHEAEFLLGVLQMREGDGVRDGDRRHIQQGMDEHEAEEGVEVLDEIHAQDGQTADEMAEGHELLRREVAIRELVAEEDSDNGGDDESAADQSDLRIRELQTVRTHIPPDERQPSPPNEEFEDHHDEELFGGG